MDYKKLYEETIEKVKGLIEKRRNGGLYVIPIKDIEDSIPELKESEDEKVRKFLVKWVNERMPVKPYDNDGFEKETVLAWIEKQGEKQHQKVIDDAYLKGISDAKKELEKQDKQKSIWSEEDSLMIDETIYFIDEFQKSDRCKNENDMQNSVTCKNWLKALKDRVGCEVNCTTTKNWSEEDDVWIERACMLLSELNDLSNLTLAKIPSNVNEIIEHIKSLRPQNQQESIEDKVNNFFDALGDCGYMQDEILRLKSIWKQAGLPQPQNHWRPSDGQMKALQTVIKLTGDWYQKELEILYQDLKKLQS